MENPSAAMGNCPEQADKVERSSYARILKSSAIVGGAEGIHLLIRMVRTKVVAMLLGPSGVGLIGIYQSAVDMLGNFSGLGIRSSGVRQVAEARGSGDSERLGRTITTLRRTCWVTGALGWLLTAALAVPLSDWVFGGADRARTLVLLGAILLFSEVSAGQTALLQGVRRIEDLARVLVFSAIGSTIVSITLYALLGERGIVPALIAAALITLCVSWRFARLVPTPAVAMNWREILREARPLLSLGLAFMWSGIFVTGVAFAIRGLIVRRLGVDASGMYQAAWAISGMFAGFILTAMGQDFYPGLTAVAHHNGQVNQLVNEQTEIGVLLALPCLLATLAFSPLVIRVFYTQKFMLAADMLPWFVFGIFGRVISWPLGFIQLAKGATRTFAITETAACSAQLSFSWAGLCYVGLKGVAVAFAATYALYYPLIYLVAVRLSGFRLSKGAIKLIAYSGLFTIVEILILNVIRGIPELVASSTLVLCSAVYCLQQLVARVGPEHRISKLIGAIPYLGRYLKV